MKASNEKSTRLEYTSTMFGNNVRCGAGKSVMYLLLILGAIQCALAWVMGATVHSTSAKLAVASKLVVTAGAAHLGR